MDVLHAAGLPQADIAAFAALEPKDAGAYGIDCARYSEFWARGHALLSRLPDRKARNATEAAAAKLLLDLGRAARERFLAAHVRHVYDLLTKDRTRHIRTGELCNAAAELIPGLTPLSDRLAAEAARMLGDKDGHEVDQGIFLAHVLGDEICGLHHCHTMLLPHPRSADALGQFQSTGTLDLGTHRLQRQGRAARLTINNPKVLNAEDDLTLDNMDVAVDVATLDAATDIAVLRGCVVEHPKYAGRHVFGSGLNLTRLYHGKIPFMFLMERDLGFVNKLLRGVAQPGPLPDDIHGNAVEKPWIAALDTFAVGGNCQILLSVDYTIAARDAFITLPARKEGIIPGAANLRLPRFVGDRMARQAIQYGREFRCSEPDALLICDEIVEPNDMETAIARVVANMTAAGPVSTISNRRTLRAAAEPLDLFRRYMAAFAREEAYCLFSGALVANLEKNWNAKARNL